MENKVMDMDTDMDMVMDMVGAIMVAFGWVVARKNGKNIGDKTERQVSFFQSIMLILISNIFILSIYLSIFNLIVKMTIDNDL